MVSCRSTATARRWSSTRRSWKCSASTAALAALVFLTVNRVEALPSPDELERVTLQVAAGETGKAELTEWFRERIS